MGVLGICRERALQLAGLARRLPWPPAIPLKAGRPAPAPRPGGALAQREGTLIGLAGAKKRYTVGPVATDVLRGVDLDIRAGELVSIMGASGSGKSTLMNIMGLLDRPTSGSCTVGGRDVSAMSDDELSEIRNRTIGFVFQSFRLLPRLTAWENVALPLTYRSIDGPETRARAESMLGKVGMAEHAEHRPEQLSGGQQQRVAIAKALVQEPKILLADEPIASLDPRNATKVMEALYSINKEYGITILCNLHHLDTARSYCERIIGMTDGQIIFDGASKALTNGKAGEIYGVEGSEEALNEVMDMDEAIAANRVAA